MIDWEAARSFTEEACAEVFDTIPCTLQPRAKGLTANHSPRNDPDRPVFDFMGSIDLEPPSDRMARHLPSDPGIRNGTVSYDAVLSAHVGSWPYLPQRDDFVIAGGVTWKIAAKEQDGSNRPAWYLVRA